MATEETINTLTHEEFENESKEFALDLEAAFNIIEDDILDLLAQAEEEGWGIEEFEKKIEELI